MFNASDFWPVLKTAGMLKVAQYQPPTGLAVSVDVGFQQPDGLMLDGLVQSTDYVIEYQTVDMPALKLGEALLIDGVTYKVRSTPRKKGDGFFSEAGLEEI